MAMNQPFFLASDAAALAAFFAVSSETLVPMGVAYALGGVR
jgi:hypothetical protein